MSINALTNETLVGLSRQFVGNDVQGDFGPRNPTAIAISVREYAVRASMSWARSIRLPTR